MLPDTCIIDKDNDKYINCVLNRMDIEYKQHRHIKELFHECIDKVYFNGSHYKIILSVCILFIMGEELLEEVVKLCEVKKTTLQNKLLHLIKLKKPNVQTSLV